MESKRSEDNNLQNQVDNPRPLEGLRTSNGEARPMIGTQYLVSNLEYDYLSF